MRDFITIDSIKMKIQLFVLALAASVVLGSCSKELNDLEIKTGAITVTGDLNYSVVGTASVLFIGDTLAGVTIASSDGEKVLAVNLKASNIFRSATYSVNNNGVTLNGESNSNLQDNANTAFNGTGGTIRIDKSEANDFQGEIRNMQMVNFDGSNITINGTFRAAAN